MATSTATNATSVPIKTEPGSSDDPVKQEPVEAPAPPPPPPLSKRKIEEEEDDEDPLDAYMKAMTGRSSSSSTSSGSKKIDTTANQQQQKKGGGGVVVQKKVVTIVTNVVNKSGGSGASTGMGVGGTAGSSGTSASGTSSSSATVEKGLIMEQGEDALEFLSDDEQTTSAMMSSEPNFEEMHIDQLPKIKTKSEQVVTDHSKIYYRPFRKNFYVEVPELAKMTTQEIDALREELEGIKVNFTFLFY